MKLAVIGHSHIKCLQKAARATPGHEFSFLQLHGFKLGEMGGADNLSVRNIDKEALARQVTKTVSGADGIVLSPTGNAPAIFGLKRPASDDGSLDKAKRRLADYLAAYRDWIATFAKILPAQAVVFPPSPPVGDNAWIQANPGAFEAALERNGISPPAYRLAIYRAWCDETRKACAEHGLRFVELPPDVFTPEGFLRECYYDEEPSHANAAYGSRMLEHLAQAFAAPPAAVAAPAKAPRRHHPYMSLPDSSFWKQAVAQVPLSAFDPVTRVPARLTRSDRVATAGSCFAQHISKRLRAGGFQFLAMEKAEGGYDFSARYGNIYTARQLLQLFDRAYGHFQPLDGCWTRPDGSFCDPFRPEVASFPTVEALEADRAGHLQAVRSMFEQLDVFVFTLGLTECWRSREDGAVYPLAPGVSAGVYDKDRHEFVNFGVADVVNDMQAFIAKLRAVNPKARLILTVSPVPLMATYTANHVSVATTYSKSVLRVVAEMLAQSTPDVYYFPSYEIITGNYNRGRYFAADLRGVTEEGVDHVMSVFMRHLTEAGGAAPAAGDGEDGLDDMAAAAEVACDEELLARR